jgi:hypothetical protein
MQVFYRNCTEISQELVYFSREKKQEGKIPHSKREPKDLQTPTFKLPITKTTQAGEIQDGQGQGQAARASHGPQH